MLISCIRHLVSESLNTWFSACTSPRTVWYLGSGKSSHLHRFHFEVSRWLRCDIHSNIYFNIVAGEAMALLAVRRFSPIKKNLLFTNAPPTSKRRSTCQSKREKFIWKYFSEVAGIRLNSVENQSWAENDCPVDHSGEIVICEDERSSPVQYRPVHIHLHCTLPRYWAVQLRYARTCAPKWLAWPLTTPNPNPLTPAPFL